MTAFGEYADDGTASTMKMRDYKDATDLVAQPVAHALCGEGFDASQSNVIQYGDKSEPLDTDGHSVAVAVYCRDVAGAITSSYGKQVDNSDTPLGPNVVVVPQPYTLAIRGRDGEPDLEYRQDGTANALLTPKGGRGGIGVGAIAHPVPFDTTQITSAGNYSNPQPGDPCHPLAAGAHAPAVAFAQNQRDEVRTMDVAGALAAEPGAKQQTYTMQAMQVRRLTPRECERLQGFPDDYTLIPHRGKPAADGPRYKALGNSMAVPVMRWIGQRIAAVDTLK